ncbi:MAG: cell division protein FtsA [Candidatus Thioglobus sp.]|jgi:cell division protein FtsA|nr:cell division protein FtsA [Candidatus Pseudothioglobus aerophilus]MBT4245141.1 cell division protein FtsA [Gammaproteobacteria bacterium]MDP0595320.1 cell division protein FtsA [Candidatus Thioglobus sp.]MBT4587582.1 cell division protein FtsA [Gammaproteobacteria bacterium]MBT4974255.1 cell division protein FtsA [Gammaproteobacteria bacterium]
MAGNHYEASIDIGTEKIALLVAEKDDDGHFRIIGHSVSSSEGVRKGSLYSIDSLARVLAKLIDQTQKSFNLKLVRARVNISDTHLSCTDGKGKVSINEVVTLEDLDSVLESAMAMSTPTNKEKLHIIKKKFTINESVVIDNPMDMEAEVLESRVHIVTVSSSSIRNIERCLEQSELEVDKIVLNSIAKSNAILTQEDKDSGVCLVDIGAGVTSYSVFSEEGIVRSGVIAFGGDEITQEIAYAFDTSIEEAKRLKEYYGVAKSSSIGEEKFIDFIQSTNKDEHQLSSLELSEVIEMAYCELFILLKNELKHHNLDGIIKSGFVLCGGASKINSIEELVRGFFSKRVKIGQIQRSRVSGLENILTDYKFTGAIGLLLHEGDLSKAEYVESNNRNGIIGKLKKVIVGNF